MKNSPFLKLSLQGFVVVLVLLTVSIFNAQSALAKGKLNTKTIFYNGEWITRVEIPVINIVANRIVKEAQLPLFKSVETVYENGEKMIHITIKDINIPATGGISNYLESNSSEELEFLPINEMIPNIQAPEQFDTSTDKNTDATNDENSISETRFDKSMHIAKKPVLNRIFNKMLKAGFDFLQKVNDGLFFKS